MTIYISICMVLLEVYINWPLESLKSDKQWASYGIFMPTSRFTDVTEEQFTILLFQCLVSIFDTGSLCSFKSKVISIPTGITQFEAPELKLCSKQFGLLYDQN